MYLMVLEVVLLGIVVFIVAPILLVSRAVNSIDLWQFLTLMTVIMEYIPHLCWSASTAELFRD